MSEGQAEPKAGAFRWNAGGWFGGQVGATAWILLLGVLLLFDDPRLGALVIAFGVAPNVLGILLWRMRDRVRAYPAIQIFVALSGAFALASFVALDLAGRISALRSGSGRSVYWALLVYPFVMVVFHLQNRAAKRRSG